MLIVLAAAAPACSSGQETTMQQAAICADLALPAAQVTSECPNPTPVPQGGPIADGDYVLARLYHWDSACGGYWVKVRESLRVAGGTFSLATSVDEVSGGLVATGTRSRVLAAQASGGSTLTFTSTCDASQVVSAPGAGPSEVQQGVATGVYAYTASPDEIDFFSTGTVADETRLVATYARASASP
jgi:hypothetical protein